MPRTSHKHGHSDQRRDVLRISHKHKHNDLRRDMPQMSQMQRGQHKYPQNRRKSFGAQ